MTRYLIASDKFKGSISGEDACAAIERGILAADPTAQCTRLPIADGGEGMAETLTAALGGSMIEGVPCTDALGRPITGSYGLAGTVAVIEMAEASGMWRIASDERDPWRASTFGTGELMRDAIARGAETIYLGLGGSATNDGGVGMGLALGVKFLDADGDAVTDLPADLEKVKLIELLPDFPDLIVACDVTNPLLGPNGCSSIYGPQKGVTDETFPAHEARLDHLVELLNGHDGLGANPAKTPGSGAAGGLGFGALVFGGGELKPGFDLIAHATGLDAAVQEADVVVTGEGKLDSQTLSGKGPAGVAAMATAAGKKVVAFGGMIEEDARAELEGVFGEVCGIRPEHVPVDECIANGARYLEAAAKEWLSD